ncbi:MAG: DUF7000 family protein [archaeon]
MKTFNECMKEYQKQLQQGYIQQAYQGLMEYFNALRLYFKKNHPNDSVSSSVYYGYMDMTYFAFVSDFLKTRKLKIAIVFLHEQFRFEVWLSGSNKKVQTKCWNLIKNNNWTKYYTPSTTKGVDSIIEHTIVDDPKFDNLDKLTKQIHEQTLNFAKDVQNFLSKHPD